MVHRSSSPKSEKSKSKGKKSSHKSKSTHHANRSMAAKYDPRRLLQQLPFSGISVTSRIPWSGNNQKETRPKLPESIEALDLRISELEAQELGGAVNGDLYPVEPNAPQDDALGLIAENVEEPVQEGINNANLAGGIQNVGHVMVDAERNYGRQNAIPGQQKPLQIFHKGVWIGNIGADPTIPNYRKLRKMRSDHKDFLAEWVREAMRFSKFVIDRPNAPTQFNDVVLLIDSTVKMVANISTFEQFELTRKAMKDVDLEIEECAAKIVQLDITICELEYLGKWADYATECAVHFGYYLRKCDRTNEVFKEIEDIMDKILICSTWAEFHDINQSMVRLTRIMNEFITLSNDAERAAQAPVFLIAPSSMNLPFPVVLHRRS